jgi:hypothetical protein
MVHIYALSPTFLYNIDKGRELVSMPEVKLPCCQKMFL